MNDNAQIINYRGCSELAELILSASSFIEKSAAAQNRVSRAVFIAVAQEKLAAALRLLGYAEVAE